jgi:hypothetical protein
MAVEVPSVPSIPAHSFPNSLMPSSRLPAPRLLRFDKDRRWSEMKTERVLVEHIFHGPTSTLLRTVSSCVYEHGGASSPNPSEGFPTRLQPADRRDAPVLRAPRTFRSWPVEVRNTREHRCREDGPPPRWSRCTGQRRSSDLVRRNAVTVLRVARP